MSDAQHECPSASILEALATGLDASEAIRAHVARCAVCAEHVRSAQFSQRFGDVLSDRVSVRRASFPAVFGYEVISEIATGGQGTVYRARQITSGQLVAIKVLSAAPGGHSAAARDRFVQEIQIVGSLSHPGIARLFDSLILDDGRQALVMELIEGEPLDRWLTPRRRQDWPAVLELLAAIVEAVHHAHQRGVIHRDLKPSNIVIDREGRPHLLDFGIAKRIDPLLTPESITRTGEFTGTLAYAAPEQVSAQLDPPDIRTDLYSLGVIGFEALAGSMPYDASGSLDSVVGSILASDPPSRSASGLPADPWTVLTKAMAKEPTRRYQSAADMARDLRRAATGQAIDARGDSRWYVLRKNARRHRSAITLATAALAGLAGIALTLAIGNARLSESLRESRMRQIRAHVAAGGRERAESVLWQEMAAHLPVDVDIQSALWAGPLPQRELLWSFVEMQAGTTCLSALRMHAGVGNRSFAHSDGSITQLSSDGQMTLVSVVEDRLRTGHTRSLPRPLEGVVAAFPTSDCLLTLGPDGIAAIDATTGERTAHAVLEGEFHRDAGFAAVPWGCAVSSEHGRLLVFSLPDLSLLSAFEGVAGSQTPWLDPARPRMAFLTRELELRVATIEPGRSAHRIESIELRPSTGFVRPQLLLSPDSATLVVAHGGGVAVHSLAGAPAGSVLMDHPGYRVWISHDPSWNLLSASAHGDPTLHLWETSGWRAREGLSGHRGTVTSHHFNPDGSRVVTADAEGTLRLWSTSRDAWRTAFGRPTASCHQIALADSSHAVFASDDVGVARLHAAGSRVGTAYPSSGGEPSLRVAYLPASDLLASAGEGPAVTLIANATNPDGAQQSVTLAHDDIIAGLRFRPGAVNPELAVMTRQGRLYRIDAVTATILAQTSLSARGELSEVCWSPSGDAIAATSRDGWITVLEPERLEITNEIHASDRQLRSLEYAPSGSIIRAVGDSGSLLSCDARSGRVASSPRLSEHSLFAIAHHPVGDVVAAGDRAGAVTLLDAATGRDLATIDAGGAVMSLRFTADGDSLFVAALDRPVARWDLTKLAGTLGSIRPSHPDG